MLVMMFMFMVVFLIERDRQGRPERFVRDHRAAETAIRDAVRSLADIVADLLKVAGAGMRPRRRVRERTPAGAAEAPWAKI